MLDQQYQKKLRLDSDHMLGNCQLRLTQLLPKLLAAILPQIMLALGKTIPLPSAKLGQCLGSRILFKKCQRRLRCQIRKDLQGPRVILFESYPNLIEQPRFLTHQPMLIAAEHFELLGLLRAGLKRPQMPMIGPEKFCQYIGIKRIALRRAHAKSVPGPIHGLRVDWIDHHSMIQRKSTIRPCGFSMTAQSSLPLARLSSSQRPNSASSSTVSPTFFSVIFWPCPSLTHI